MDTRILLYRLQSSSWCLTVASQANIIMTRCQASNLLDFRDQINVHSSVNYEASYKLQSWKMGPAAASELCLEDSKKCETWPSLTLVSTTFKSFKNAVFQSRIVITRLYMLLTRWFYKNHYAINIMIIIDVGMISTQR